MTNEINQELVPNLSKLISVCETLEPNHLDSELTSILAPLTSELSFDVQERLGSIGWNGAWFEKAINSSMLRDVRKAMELEEMQKEVEKKEKEDASWLANWKMEQAAKIESPPMEYKLPFQKYDIHFDSMAKVWAYAKNHDLLKQKGQLKLDKLFVELLKDMGPLQEGEYVAKEKINDILQRKVPFIIRKTV